MTSDKRKKRYLLILLVTAPFFVGDTAINSKITQMIWDNIPMDFQNMVFWGIIIIIYVILFRVMIGLFYYSSIAFTKEISNHMRKQVYANTLEQKEWIKSSDIIINTLNNDINLLEIEYYYSGIMLLAKTIEIFVACIIVLFENAFYGGFCFLIMLIPVFLSKKSGDKIKGVNEDIRECKKEYMNFTFDIGRGKDTIRCYQMIDIILGIHGGIAGNLEKKNTDKSNELSNGIIINQNMNRCANGVILLVGFYMASKGNISLGWVMAFSQLSSSMTYTLVDAMQEGMKVYGCRSIKKKLCQKYNLESYISDIKKKEKPSVKFSKLVCNIKGYSVEGKSILQNINFILESGDKVLIMGENGSGKTTLLKILLGLIEKTDYEGNIQWINENGDSMFQPEGYIAYISQTPFVFHESVKKNIILDSNLNKKRYDAVKKTVNLKVEDEKIVSHLQENISGGEKQKIEIARAIYSGRSVFIFDEPYSSLDQKSLIEIEKKILCQENKTVITISHAVNENIKLYNKILTLKNGKLVEENC